MGHPSQLRKHTGEGCRGCGFCRGDQPPVLTCTITKSIPPRRDYKVEATASTAPSSTTMVPIDKFFFRDSSSVHLLIVFLLLPPLLQGAAVREPVLPQCGQASSSTSFSSSSSSSSTSSSSSLSLGRCRQTSLQSMKYAPHRGQRRGSFLQNCATLGLRFLLSSCATLCGDLAALHWRCCSSLQGH